MLEMVFPSRLFTCGLDLLGIRDRDGNPQGRKSHTCVGSILSMEITYNFG